MIFRGTIMKTFKQFIKENYTSLTEQNPPFYPATPAGESLRSKALVPNNPTTSGSTKSGTGGTGGTGPNRPPFSAPYRDIFTGAKGVLPRIFGMSPPPPNQILDPKKYGVQFKNPEESAQSNFKDVNLSDTADKLDRASNFTRRFTTPKTVSTPDTSKFVSTQKTNNMRTDMPDALNNINDQLERSRTGQPDVTSGGGRFVGNVPPIANKFDPDNPTKIINVTGAIEGSKKSETQPESQ